MITFLPSISTSKPLCRAANDRKSVEKVSYLTLNWCIINRRAVILHMHPIEKWSIIQTNRQSQRKTRRLQPLNICGCPRSLQMALKHYMVDCLPLWRVKSLNNRRLFDRLTVCLCARRIIVQKAAFLTGKKSYTRGWLGKLIDQWSACFRAALIWICPRCQRRCGRHSWGQVIAHGIK